MAKLPIYEKIDAFVRRNIPPVPPRSNKTKFIHDPLWGTIEIHAYEQAILDTPLIQRLRQIHQTGFVYETYPSARHTRFEHTIGVMHVAGKMAAVLTNRAPGYCADPESRTRVRLAALLHDTGHSAFSHTTEEIYKTCEDIKALRAPGGTFSGKGEGEILSFLIATSDAFREYFDKIKEFSDELNPITIDDFSGLIIGRPNNLEHQYEADIISGSFDADKLDYFPRDGRATGIELSVDIEHLLHCIEIQNIPNEDGIVYHSLVVNRGGYNSIQQLLFARATLFASVYHHQKVRSCDCLIKAIFEAYAIEGKRFQMSALVPGGFDFSSAADFLFITDNDFYTEYVFSNKESPSSLLLKSLKDRDLFKRVLTISTYSIKDMKIPKAQEPPDEVSAGYGEFYNLRENPTKLRDLAKEVYADAKTTCSELYVWFDIPKRPNLDSAGRARINMSPRNTEPKIEPISTVIPVEDWVSTYETYYAQSYLFGPSNSDDRIKLAVTALKILKAKFHIELLPYAIADDIRERVGKIITAQDGEAAVNAEPAESS